MITNRINLVHPRRSVRSALRGYGIGHLACDLLGADADEVLVGHAAEVEAGPCVRDSEPSAFL